MPVAAVARTVRRPEHYPLEETCTIRLCGKTRLRARRKVKPQGLALLCCMVMVSLRSISIVGHIPPATQLENKIRRRHSLQQFKSLSYPLAKSKIVAVYFGASYCPENRLLRDVFLRDERLLPQEGIMEDGDLIQNKRFDLSIVYVASDSVEGSSEWIHVLSEVERAKLRELFGVGPLQNTGGPSHSIPSLFVIDSKAYQVMTPMGLVDVKERRRRALDKWLTFQSSISELDPKDWASPELLFDEDASSQTSQPKF